MVLVDTDFILNFLQIDAVQLVADYINDLKESRQILIACISSLGLAMVAFFVIYRKEKHISEIKFMEMNDKFITVIREDIKAKNELTIALNGNKTAIENISKIIENTLNKMH